MPKVVAERPDEWDGEKIVPGTWRVNCGYYGPDASYDPRKPIPLGWVIEAMTPYGEASARELAALGEKITALVLKNLNVKPDAVLDAIRENPGISPLQAMFIIQIADPKTRVRLRAERVAGGWRIAEYDFGRWTEIIPV